MPEEERKSYIIVRVDGLAIHTKPITRKEALWLEGAYAARFVNRESRARYLSEWGNVIDLGENVRRLAQQLERLGYGAHFGILGVYGGPDRFMEKVDWLRGLKNLPPEARRALGELLDRLEDFLRRPVEPKPVEAPARYLEMPDMHVVFECCSDRVKDVVPRPEWYAYHGYGFLGIHGISVFKDSLWLWQQTSWYVQAVAVRRDVDGREVIDAVLKDEAVQGFLKEVKDEYVRRLISEHEKELREKGYENAVRKVKVILATLDLLTAGRREEALPA